LSPNLDFPNFFTNVPTFFPPISPKFFFPKIFSLISQLPKSILTLLSAVSKGNYLPLLSTAVARNSIPRVQIWDFQLHHNS
ncbi:hypothetical protein ES319_A02G092900v1, partial [Gossypium barbadense]